MHGGYVLRNPEGVRRVESWDVPSHKKLLFCHYQCRLYVIMSLHVYLCPVAEPEIGQGPGRSDHKL
jgi:hypothetical protein